MLAYAGKALRVHLRGGRALFLLAVAGVALGVGAVLSIQILNGSALGAFAGSVRAISGEAQLSVVGRGPTFPDRLLVDVLSEPGVKVAIPIYRVEVALERSEVTLEVLGTDLLAPVRSRWSVPTEGWLDALSSPGWVAVTPSLAAQMGWRRGDRLHASSGSRQVELRIGALVDFQRISPLASRRLAVMDLAQVQALLGAPGRLTQLDVAAAEGADVADLQRRLEARLGPTVRVVTPEARVAEAGALLAAFRLNLTALSLVSLFVGGFLIYASTRAALVRRREELGVLRCLGATRAQVVGLVLAEAALLGLVGTALGIPLGWLAARANVSAVSATVRSVYLLEGVERVTVSPSLLAVAAALGLAGALAGSLVPAFDVAREDPRALLARPVQGAALDASPRRAAVVAVLLLAAVAGVTLGPARGWRGAGFALALGVLAAVPLLSPLVLRATALVPAARRLGVRFGVVDLSAHLRSTAVAAGALAVAASMLASITVMIGSFRHTVDDWLAATLRADVYVRARSWRRGASDATLAPGVVARLAGAPGVVAIDRLRQITADAGGRAVTVSGFDAGLADERGRVQLVDGGRAAEREVLRRLRHEGAVIVSEPLARRMGLRAGGTVLLTGATGPLEFRVAGVYRDYGAESGAVMLDLATQERRFGPGPLTNVALYLAPGVDVERAVDRLRAQLEGEPLVIRSNRRLRADVFGVFDQTFAVTRLLQVMSLVVAASGVTLALLVLGRERSGEVALLRALGATRGQVFRLFVGRALGIAVSGLALGAAAGAALALVLVRIVNPAWFGWSIGLSWPWRTLAGQAFVLLAAALLASVYPAARASGTPATELSRDAV